jgi:Polyketide cyclase / dehydrase and lipid transport
MGPWFKCGEAGEEFLDSAPARLRASFEIARPAAEVWADLTGEHPLAYCRVIDDISWTSPRPFGVGTTRTATALKGANILRERYFRWEEGSRHSFAVEETTSPLFRRFAEDYLVEPTGDSSCRYTWTIAYEPRSAAVLLNPVNKRLLATLFTDTAKFYGAA